MEALCWMDDNDIQVREVPDPEILTPRDAVIDVDLAGICGSDLHLYDGFIPTMEEGDIIGHEAVGTVVDLGAGVDNLSIGDRVVVPFPIACGNCHYCHTDDYALCDNSNPNAWMAEQAYGHAPAAIFGYSHMMGGYAGAQAEYLRVPFADVGPMPLPDDVTDEQGLMLADIFPTGYHAAYNCDIDSGDTVAVWGCGPVGLFTIESAYLQGADQVIAVDSVPERLEMASHRADADVLNLKEDDVLAEINEMTGGRGPDACIDAVGLEAHGASFADDLYDSAKTTLGLETDRSNALRQAIMACGKGGTVSIPGVYGGVVDKMPLGAAFNKALEFQMGQTPVHAYLEQLNEHIQKDDIDPSYVVSHRVPLQEAPAAYDMFKEKRDEAIKVVVEP
jgi:threonine dehydrogenase-like Zn-dependent dehydrogenase